MKRKVLVGMSSGVDSTVTAIILKEMGYDVTGITMNIWKETEKKNDVVKNACFSNNKKKIIEDTSSICEKFDFPHYVIDCSNEFQNIVLKNFQDEYISGRTPNPCVLCNSIIKFDLLLSLAKEEGIEFDKFATGHYARIEYSNENNRYFLKKGINQKKDQSYFLYRLRQNQLVNILLPLGDYTKEQIREIAKQKGLSVFDKPDSQDFYSGDYSELLEVMSQEGNIVDRQGNILGRHKGIWNFTIGQRKGLGIAAPQPLYVLELDKNSNKVIVGYEGETFNKTLIANNLNWIAIHELSAEIRVKAKFRSTQIETDVIVKPVNKDSVQVEFIDIQKSITLGQSIVFYDGDIVIGGGIIDKVLK